MTREEFLAQQELYKLQEEIQKKEQEKKLYEDNLKLVEPPAGIPDKKVWDANMASYTTASPIAPASILDPNDQFDKQNYNQDVLELNSLIDIYEQKNSEYYSTFLPKTAPPEDSQVQDFEDTEQKFDKDFTEQDLLAPWKAEYPGVPEHQLLDIVSVMDPELYAKLNVGGEKDDIPKLDTPESSEFKFPKLGVPSPLSFYLPIKPGGGFLSQEIKDVQTQFTKQWFHDMPGFWSAHSGRPFSSPERNREILKELLRENPLYINDESKIHEAVNYLEKYGKLEEGIRDEYYRRGRAYHEKRKNEDTEYAAHLEYKGSRGEAIFEKNGGMGISKTIVGTLSQAGRSVLESQGIGQSASYITGLISNYFVPGSGPAVGTAANIISQFLYGTGAQGASSEAAAIESLINEQVIDEERFSRVIDELRDELKYQMHPKTKRKRTLAEVEDGIKKYIEMNYEDRNGQIIRLPYDANDAGNAVAFTGLWDGVGSGIIETADVVFTKGMLPFSGSTLKAASFSRLLEKTDKFLRKAPIISHWGDMRKIKVGAGWKSRWFNNSVDVLAGRGAKQWGEMFEEVVTENFMAGNQIYGPMFQTQFKYDKGANWGDVWGFKSHIIDPALGGFGGGKVFNAYKNSTNLMLEVTGIKNKLTNLSTDNQFKKNINDGLVVIKDGPAEYRLEQMTSFVDDKGEISSQPSEPNLIDPDTGQRQTNVYSSRESAQNVASMHNIIRREEGEKRIVANNRVYYKSEAKIEEDDDGGFTVAVYNQKGKLQKRMSRHKDKSQAKKQLGIVNENISKVTKAIDRIGIDKVNSTAKKTNKKTNTVISNIENNEEIDGLDWVTDDSNQKDLKNINKKVKNQIKNRELLSKKHYVTLLKGYQIHQKKTDGESVIIESEEQDIYDKLIEGGYLTNPEVIKAGAEAYSDIFDDELLDKDAFIKDYKEEFSGFEINESIFNDVNYTDDIAEKEEAEKRKELLLRVGKFDPEDIYEDPTGVEDEVADEFEGETSRDIADLMPGLVDEKKAPEVKEDMVTIPGNAVIGPDETVTRAEAEKRLEQLLRPTHLPGEEGVQDDMIAGAEIEALQEALAKKKAPEKKAPEVKEDTIVIRGDSISIKEAEKLLARMKRGPLYERGLEKRAKGWKIEEGDKEHFLFMSIDAYEKALEVYYKKQKKAPEVKVKAIVNEIKKNGLYKGLKKLIAEGVTQKQIQKAFTENPYLEKQLGEMMWWTEELGLGRPELQHEIIPFLDIVHPEIAKHWAIFIGWDYTNESDRDKSSVIINKFIKEPKDLKIVNKQHQNIPEWAFNPEMLENIFTQKYSPEDLAMMDMRALNEYAESIGLSGPKLVDFIRTQKKAPELTKEDIEKEVKRLEALAEKKAPGVKVSKAAGKPTPPTEGYTPTLTPGEVVMYNGKDYIVRKVNQAGKVQLIDRETRKNFPGTPNESTIKESIALEQLPTTMWNGYEYALDLSDHFIYPNIYSLSSGKLITDKSTVSKIRATFDLTKEEIDEVDDKGLEIRKGVKHFVKKVISGFQDGADIIGVKIAKELGYETGGIAPKGWKTTTGEKKELMEGYGGIEGKLEGYPYRTVQNIKNSDGTVVYAKNLDSPGTKMTRTNAKKYAKPYIENPTTQELEAWLVDNKIETLNVAGNRVMEESDLQSLKDVLTPTEEIEKVETEDILTARADDIKLTGDQEKALKIVDKVIPGFDKMGKEKESDNERIIAGYAGTGKTTIIENIINAAKHKKYNVFMASPTNKASQVLRDKLSHVTRDIKTIHQLFTGPPDRRTGRFIGGASSIISGKNGRGPFSEGDLLIFDESSMISATMYKWIEEFALNTGATVIFLGDGFQLPPVDPGAKYDSSLKRFYINKEFNLLAAKDYEMTYVRRQSLQSAVLKYVTALRNMKVPFVPNVEKLSEEGSFRFVPDVNTMLTRLARDNKNVGDIASINFTNPGRVGANHVARVGRYNIKGITSINDSENNPVMSDEILIAINNSHKDDDLNRANGEVFQLNEFESFKEIKGLKYYDTAWNNITQQRDKTVEIPVTAYHIITATDDILLFTDSKKASISGVTKDTRILLPSKLRHPKDNKVLGHVIIANYGYSMTAHKSQGSQFKDVIVDPNLYPESILLKKPENFARWLYTALTRTENDAYLSDDIKKYIKTVSWQEIEEINRKSEEKMQYKSTEDSFVQSPANQAKTKKYAKMLKNKFSGKVELEFVNDINAKDKFGRPFAARYDIKNNKILINLAFSTPDTPFHEFSHPFITEMRLTNPTLFNNLIKEALNTERGKNLIKTIVDAYNEDGLLHELSSELEYELSRVDGDVQKINGDTLYNILSKNDNDFIASEELLAFAVSEIAVEKVPTESKWIELFNKVMEWIKHKLFGPSWTVDIYARALDVDTSMSDLARLMANSNRRFGLETIDRKLVDESFDFKINNKFKFLSFAKKESEKIEDKDRSAAWLNNFFENIWDKADYDKTKKRNREEYSLIMNNILPPNAKPHFSKWYRTKFRRPMPDKDNSKFSLSGPLRDIGIKYIDSNIEMLNEMSGRVSKDERELASGDILFIKEFGMSITLAQLGRMAKLAHGFDTYQQWEDALFREVLRTEDRDIPTWKKEGLMQYYNRIKSTARTNSGDIGQDQVTNYELLIKADGSFNFVRKGPEKKFKTPKEKKGNPGFQKKTLADYNPDIYELFGWLSSTDIKVISEKQTELGVKSKIDNLYDFLDGAQLEALDKYLINNHGLTIAFSRGDSTKIALVNFKNAGYSESSDVTIEKMGAYLQKQISKGYMTKAQAKKYLNNMSEEKNWKVRAANMAIHDAMVKVYPKYLSDKGGGANVLKRFKIPFTPVTVNEMMPDSRVIQFDPKKVMFQYKNGEPFSPYQKVEGKKKEYIGDGETITSKKRFSIFNKFHGLSLGTAIAKTVHYLKLGDLVYAKKHQHFQAEAGLKITDKKGRNLFKISDNGNIYLGSAHPLYKEGGDNYVDELSTSDEIKIGTETIEEQGYDGIMSSNLGEGGRENELFVPGSAVGFIKYEDTMDRYAKHPQQWYNYVTSPIILGLFKKFYLPRLDASVQGAIRYALDGTKLTSVEKIAKLAEALESNGLGRVPVLHELVRMGGGLHMQLSGVIDRMIQTRIIEPALQLAKNVGSTYNIAMDVTGTLRQGEIGISRQQAHEVIKAYKKANNLKSIEGVSNEEINTWLATNDVYTMVTRFPVPHEGGALMAKVRILHDRKAVVMMNINDVKGRLEGDNDGDHVEIEFLPSEEMTEAYVKHLDAIKITPLDLQELVDKSKKDDMLSSKGRSALIAKLTLGQKAIGEIANIQAAYGSLRQIYENIGGIRFRDPNEKIRVEGMYQNGNNYWEGTVSDYLRTYLQAAVDNAKFGLLGQWKYSRENVLKNLVPADVNIDLIMDVVSLHLDANRIRNGRTFDKGNFSFRDTLEMSNEYYAYTLDRVGYLRSKFELSAIVKNNDLTPIEAIAIAPAKAMAEMISKHPKTLDGFDVSPYIIMELLQKNAHISTMRLMDLAKQDYMKSAIDKDGKSKKDLDWILKQNQKGREYADDMGSAFDLIRDEFQEMGAQSLDYNEHFKDWIETWHKGFNELSNTAQVAATYRFLQGYISQKTGNPTGKLGLYLPAVSDKPNQANMLDANIIKDYFKNFNKEVRDEQNLDSEKNYVVPAYASMDSIARGLCGI